MGRRRGKGGVRPRWYVGRLIRDDIGGFWHGEYEGKLFMREGKLVDRANYDSLTDKERDEQINRR